MILNHSNTRTLMTFSYAGESLVIVFYIAYLHVVEKPNKLPKKNVCTNRERTVIKVIIIVIITRGECCVNINGLVTSKRVCCVKCKTPLIYKQWKAGC